MQGRRLRTRRTLRRGQLAVPWAILFVGLLMAFVLMSMKLTLLYMYYYKYLHEEYEMSRWAIGQHLSLVSYEFIPAGIGKYKLRVTLVNDGEKPIKIGYAEVCLRYVAKNLKAYYCAWLDTNVTIETSKHTGFFVLPSEEVTITTTKTMKIWQILTYTPQVTIIDPTTLNTITITIPIRSAMLELNAYVRGSAPSSIDVKMFRIDNGVLSGLQYEFYKKVTYNEVPAYLGLKNIMPGTYLLDITLSSSGEVFHRKDIVTLTPGQVAHLHIDISGPIPHNVTQGVAWMLSFDDVPKTWVEALIRSNAISWYGNWTYQPDTWWFGPASEAGTRYNSHGLIFTVPENLQPNETFIFRTPALKGHYRVIIAGTFQNIELFSAELLIDGVRVPASVRVVNTSSSEYDWVVEANVTFTNTSVHNIVLNVEAVPSIYGPSIVTINRVAAIPWLGYKNLIVKWIGTLWPGDIYELEENSTSGQALLVKLSNGLATPYYYPCDNASTTPQNRYPSDNYWDWSPDPAVMLNSTQTWLWASRSFAKLEFNVYCPTSNCTVYAWAYSLGNAGTVVAYYVDTNLIVDGDIVDTVAAQNTWYLLKARNLGVGNHNITVAMNYVTTLQNTPALKAAIDNIMAVRSPYITIEGLRPGYEVVIKDLRTGNEVYRVVAKSDTVLINAEEIGIVDFPMEAEIDIIRS